ncbi:TIGR01841 family phasin [Glaciecola sp. 1036]|uniref:TIGR01841 family phasin n=1 Tax=Alteromonadaceae TaxID=72275 RepID=UPI003D02FD85
MFGNFSEQFKKSTKPASSLLEMNAKAMTDIAGQQTLFFKGLMDDSKKLVETVTTQSELKGVIAAHSVYAESIRERMSSASKSTYGTLNEVREQMTELVKGSIEEASSDAKQAVEKAVEKVATATKKAETVTKEAAKAAPVAKPAAPKKAAPKKAPAKSTTKKATTSTAAKATTTTKAAAKPAPKATASKTTVKAAPKPEATPAVKPKAKVADLKADEVKAAPKKD